MARGTITDLYPPTNDGTRRGAGSLTDDTDGKKHIFQTPGDNGGALLEEGMLVEYTLDEHGNIAAPEPGDPPTMTPA